MVHVRSAVCSFHMTHVISTCQVSSLVLSHETGDWHTLPIDRCHPSLSANNFFIAWICSLGVSKHSQCLLGYLVRQLGSQVATWLICNFLLTKRVLGPQVPLSIRKAIFKFRLWGANSCDQVIPASISTRQRSAISLSDLRQLKVRRPYHHAQTQPAWRDRTHATHTQHLCCNV